MLKHPRWPRWPHRPKRVFDASARRRSDRALDKLVNARTFIEQTRTDDGSGLWHLPQDLDSSAAWEVLQAAIRAVHAEYQQANEAAKRLERGS